MHVADVGERIAQSAALVQFTAGQSTGAMRVAVQPVQQHPLVAEALRCDQAARAGGASRPPTDAVSGAADEVRHLIGGAWMQRGLRMFEERHVAMRRCKQGGCNGQRMRATAMRTRGARPLPVADWQERRQDVHVAITDAARLNAPWQARCNCSNSLALARCQTTILAATCSRTGWMRCDSPHGPGMGRMRRSDSDSASGAALGTIDSGAVPMERPTSRRAMDARRVTA